MSGTSIGSKKAVQTILKNNPNHFKEIGSKGGKLGHTGGFYANPKLAREAGAKGGRNGKRGKAKAYRVHYTWSPRKDGESSAVVSTSEYKPEGLITVAFPAQPHPKKKSIFSKLFRRSK